MNWPAIQSADLSFAQKAEQMLLAIAPADLGRRPLYVLPVFSLSPGIVPRDCLGVFHSLLDLHARRDLERQNRWRGRGAALAIFDRPGIDDREFISIALHEAAHAIDNGDDLAADDLPEVVEAFQMASPDFAVAVNTTPPTDLSYLRLPKWHNHELPFLRVALHLLHRAARLGFHSTPAACGVAGEQYGLSSGEQYQAALGAEPWRFEGMPLREVLDRDPPQAFSSLWANDTAR